MYPCLFPLYFFFQLRANLQLFKKIFSFHKRFTGRKLLKVLAHMTMSLFAVSQGNLAWLDTEIYVQDHFLLGQSIEGIASLFLRNFMIFFFLAQTVSEFISWFYLLIFSPTLSLLYVGITMLSI